MKSVTLILLLVGSALATAAPAEFEPAPVAEAPVAEEIPVAEARTAEVPAAETPAAESSIVETPVAVEPSLPFSFHRTGNSFVYSAAGSPQQEGSILNFLTPAPIFKAADGAKAPFIPAFTYSSPFVAASVKSANDDEDDSTNLLANYFKFVNPSVTPFGFKPLFTGFGVAEESSTEEQAEQYSADSSAEAEGKVVVEPAFSHQVVLPSLYHAASPAAVSLSPFFTSGSHYTLPTTYSSPFFYSGAHHGFPFMQPHQYVVAKAASEESD